MAISRGRLENRIIIAFIIVAISPLLISFAVSLRIVGKRLEREIEGRLKKASQVLEERIEELERKSVIIGKILVKEPEFVELFLAKDATGMKEFLARFKKEFPIDVILVREGEKGTPGKHIFRIETERWKSMVAGGVIPVILGGESRGRVILGYVLGNEFAQFLSHSLGVEVRLFTTTDSPSSPTSFPGIEVSEEAKRKLLKGEEFYDTRSRIGNHPFFVYLKPLLGEGGKVLGVAILSLPKTFTFQTVVIRFLPPFLFIWFFISGALGYFLARGVMKPIKEFTQGARAIAQGNLDQFIPVRTRDEIGRLAQAFNRMAQELKKMRELEESLRRNERLITLGEIAAGIAHEVRNPLGVIKNSAQVLKKRKGNKKEESELLDFIIEESERLERFIQDLLHFVRLPRPQKKKVELRELMERTLMILQGEFSRRGIQVVKEFPLQEIPLHVDPGQFHQMLLNLLINSLDAMPEGGILRVRVKAEDSFVEIRVKDTGQGISEDIKGKIFEPFFTTKEGGTGLGLSIVSTVVKSHGGNIRVESKEGEGSEFILKFPQEG